MERGIQKLERKIARLESQLTRMPKPHVVQSKHFNTIKRVPANMRATDLENMEIVLVDDKSNNKQYLATRIEGKFKFIELNNADALVRDGSSVVDIVHGGTGGLTATGAFDNLSPMALLGDIIIAIANGLNARLAGNTTTTKKFLSQTGDGAASAAPVWSAVDVGDIQDAKADEATKGVATFKAADFDDDGNGLISIDYTNGQAAASGVKGLLTGADWDTFNGKQAQDADLDALAALASTGLLARTAAAAYSERTITGTANKIVITNGNGVSGNPTINLPDNPIIEGNIKGNNANGASSVKMVYKKTFTYGDAGSAFNVIELPENAVNWTIKVNITTSFNGSGTDLLDIGVTGEGNRYKDDLDISATGWNDADTNLPDKMSGTTQITAEYTDENSDATQGAGEIYVEYSLF